jgi:hypothetical protein
MHKTVLFYATYLCSPALIQRKGNTFFLYTQQYMQKNIKKTYISLYTLKYIRARDTNTHCINSAEKWTFLQKTSHFSCIYQKKAVSLHAFLYSA